MHRFVTARSSIWLAPVCAALVACGGKNPAPDAGGSPPDQVTYPPARAEDAAAASSAGAAEPADASAPAAAAPDTTAAPDTSAAAIEDAGPPPAPLGPPRAVAVQVLSATLKDKVVADAQIILQKEGQASVSGVTDAQGKASITQTFGVDDASVKLIVKKDGFSPLVVSCPCDGMSYAVSETLAQLDAFRVVLNWGDEPQDLDLHVAYPGNHIFFREKTGADADLDVDDTNGFGPETITIRKRHTGENYVFAVHNYSVQGIFGDRSLAASQAKVFIYVGQSLLRTYYVPTTQPGELWVLFAVDGSGAIHDISNLVDVSEAYRLGPYLNQLAQRADFGFPTRAAPADKRRAADLVASGEAALAAGDAERAASDFQRAVARDRNATAAYSGLARAYGKLGRAAESAWASRKAAELAALPAQSGYRVPNEKTALTTSSALKPWKQYTFTGPNLIDDNLWTSWQPNRTAKGGVGEWIKMTFTEPQTLTGFEFSNGFRRLDDLGDLYTMNNRIENATVELSDGTKLPIHFDDVPREATIMLPESKTVTWVKLTVDSVFKGTEWNDLAVSEFHALAKEE